MTTLIGLDGTPAATPEATSPAPATPVPDAAAPTPEAAAPSPGQKWRQGERDIDIPDAYWDKENSTVNVEALLKSQADLRKQVSAIPKAPETYDLAAALPEEFKGKLDFSADNPIVAKGLDLMKKHSVTQEGAAEMAAWLAERDAAQARQMDEMVSKFQKDEEENAAKMRAETVAILGGEERFATLKQRAAEVFGGEPFQTTPAGWKALNTLLDGQGSPALPSGRDGGAGGRAALTEAELSKMTQDPRYWKIKDPAFRKQVSDGFAALYPEKGD